MIMRRLLVLPVVLLLAGCGEMSPSQMLPSSKYGATKSEGAVEVFQNTASAPSLYRSARIGRTAEPAAAATDKGRMMSAGMMGAAMMSDGPVLVVERGALDQAKSESVPADGSGPAPAPAGLDRKIIYDAQIGLVVEDFAKAEAQVVPLVTKAGGYVAEMQLTGSPGAQRSGRWKVRVPADTFESFLSGVSGLGELERNSRTSDDVSDQFYDIQARIKNKKTTEERLTQILKETTGKIEDVLKVETELSRVRGEIEQMEGRIRVLENLTSLTTITIDIREREVFRPEPPVQASFPTQVKRTFESSVQGLVDLGQGLVLLAVDWVLWLPIVAIVVLFAWLLGRFVLRRLVQATRWAWENRHQPIGGRRDAPAPATETPGP
jgi:hypothetical protein